MKRLLLTLLAAGICLSLASCAPKDSVQTQETSAKPTQSALTSDSTGDTARADTPVNASSMRKIADAMEATGLFGDSMELHVKGDEYAADILEFTYGIKAEERHVADYVISEQTSKQAYSFALVIFGEDSAQADVDEVEKAFREVYLADLKSALEVYNPEAYAMCEGALIERGRADMLPGGDESTQADFVLLIISDSNSEARAALTDGLGK